MCARALIFGFIWQDGFNVLVLCETPSLKLVRTQVFPSRGSLNLWVPRGGGHPPFGSSGVLWVPGSKYQSMKVSYAASMLDSETMYKLRVPTLRKTVHVHVILCHILVNLL